MAVELVRAMRLLQFGDSMLPIGAFAFSNALETAVAQGIVADATSLRAFVSTSLRQAVSGDAIALLHAHRAARRGDVAGVIEADHAVIQRKLNDETRVMSCRMGKKLGEVGRRVLPNAPTVAAWLAAIDRAETPGTLPVGLGLLFAELGSSEEDAFATHQYGTAFTILSAALRLMRIDHLEVQSILFDVAGAAEDDYTRVADRGLDEMAFFAPTVDILAAIHVTSHVRLFMS